MQWKFLKYGLLFLLPISAWIAFNSTGVWTYGAVILAFIIIPSLELLIKPDPSNLEEVHETIASQDRKYDYLLYFSALVHWLLLFYFLIHMNSLNISFSNKIGMMSSMGILCGVTGINLAHELGHRTNKQEIWLAWSLLLTSLYMHFYIEHNRGHHKNVATQCDPATARYGENIYSFWIRSMIGSYIAAWRLEKKRLKSKNVNAISWKNEMLRFTVAQAFFLIIIATVFSIQVLFFFIGSAFIGAILLETVNYIEHYGLQRRINTSGRPERVQPVHSWNSDHVVGRMFLFELSRHSDHHFLATRPYQILRSYENAPQMPTGYPGMMLLALFPPLWFRIMNTRVAQHTD